MISRTLFAATALLAGSACSATPSTAQQNAAPPQPAEASQPVPENAPLDRSIKNVPATAGRANRPQTPAPFAIATIGRFDAPFAMAFLPDGALLVTEKAGHLKLRSPDGAVVDVGGVPSVEQGGQGGLLDVAIAPDFASSRSVYLSYAEPGAQGPALALARGTLKLTPVQCVRAPCPAQARLDDVKVLWRSGSNGPGGQFGSVIAFAPDGKSLFLASGERQRFTPAQDPSQGLGKILRLTLDGNPAPGNPLYPEGQIKAATWSSGHRNPYGLAFAPDGRLWEVEMGPKGGDEVNLIERGGNYGWPIVSNGDNYSGQPIPDHPSKPEFAAPKAWWNPSISPAGMIYYTGAMFARYRNSLFIGAMSKPGLIRVAIDGATATPAENWNVLGTRIRDVAQAPDGAIWLLEDGGRGPQGRLFRLTPKP